MHEQIKNKVWDVVVIGTGPSGVNAAQTLVEAELEVLSIDGGKVSKYNQEVFKDTSFLNLRKNDKKQKENLLGQNFESINLEKTKIGAQLTPQRKHLIEDVAKFFKTRSSSPSKTFQNFETLATGGLGVAWGLGCCEFSDEELSACGLDVNEMRESYQEITDRIGVSKADDNVEEYTLKNSTTDQETLKLDNLHKFIDRKFRKRIEKHNSNNFYAGRPSIAVLTKDTKTRKAENYDELGFYSNYNKSAYRPEVTLEELYKKDNFTHLQGYICKEYIDQNDSVTLKLVSIEDSKEHKIKAKKLILCASAIGNARIILKSHEKIKSLPLLSNPYSYLTAIIPQFIGKFNQDKRSSHVQYSAFYKPNNFGVSMASFYSYRSLMLFRTTQEVPLAIKDSINIMKSLLHGTIILGIHHPDNGEGKRELSLESDESLNIDFNYSDKIKNESKQRNKAFKKFLLSLGVIPLKSINPGPGSSIHYAGSLMNHVESNGIFKHNKNVYIADASAFKYLPAKGLTLSLMSNANRVAKHLIKDFNK